MESELEKRGEEEEDDAEGKEKSTEEEPGEVVERDESLLELQPFVHLTVQLVHWGGLVLEFEVRVRRHEHELSHEENKNQQH